MIPPRTSRLAVVLASTTQMFGCVAEEPLPQPSWCEAQPDAVDYRGTIEMWSFGVPLGELCEGSWERAQEHADWVAEIWGEGEGFGYALYDSAENVCWPCPDYAEACAAVPVYG
ncbi:MAG: hypothetical protein KC431_03000 [Myxococcales bacterium]|nr:hypothetical protein [Myxococcales bacterium]